MSDIKHTSEAPTDVATDEHEAVRRRQITSAKVTADIAATTSELAKVEAHWTKLAFEKATGAQNLDAEIARLRRTRADLTEKLETLRAIHGHAVAQERQADKRRTNSITASRIRAARQHLAARNKDAAMLSKAIEEAVLAYRLMIQRGEKVRAASPLSAQVLAGSLTTRDAIRIAVESEIFRLGGDASPTGFMSFPGGKAADLRYLNNPAGLQSLGDRLKIESAYLIGEFNKLLAQLDGADAPLAPIEPAPEPRGSTGLATS